MLNKYSKKKNLKSKKLKLSKKQSGGVGSEGVIWYKMLQKSKSIKELNKSTDTNADIGKYEDININDLAKQLANPDNKNASKLFEKYITSVRNNPTRSQEYDIRVLTSIMAIMHDYEKPVNYSLGEKTINANRPISCCKKAEDNKLQFFAEDFYCDDLNKFSEEYDKFINSETKQSDFFYKSNIANIALLFKCYYKRCFDEYFKIDFKKKTFMNSIFNHIKKENLDTIFIEFKNYKDLLIRCLIQAYKTCVYEDVCDLYVNYLNFYNKHIAILFKTHDDIDIFTDHFADKYSKQKLNITSLEQIHSIINSEVLQTIISTLEFGDNNGKFYIYLSCSIVSEYKQARLYMTRILNSYIGHGYIHEGELKNNLVNTFDIIAHDFYFHYNLRRLESTNADNYDNIYKEIMIGLYNYKEQENQQTNSNVYKFGMFLIQYCQNEDDTYRKRPFIVTNEIDNFYHKNMKDILVEYWSQHLKYIGDKTLDMTDEETKKYNILYKKYMKLVFNNNNISSVDINILNNNIMILSKHENKLKIINLFIDYITKLNTSKK